MNLICLKYWVVNNITSYKPRMRRPFKRGNLRMRKWHEKAAIRATRKRKYESLPSALTTNSKHNSYVFDCHVCLLAAFMGNIGIVDVMMGARIIVQSTSPQDGLHAATSATAWHSCHLAATKSHSRFDSTPFHPARPTHHHIIFIELYDTCGTVNSPCQGILSFSVFRASGRSSLLT